VFSGIKMACPTGCVKSAASSWISRIGQD